MNNIEREIEKILQEKGVAQTVMTPEQFIQKLQNKLDERIPIVLDKTINELATQIMNDEFERLGRGEPCKFWRPGRQCISSQKEPKEPDCLECTNYKPRSRWQRLVRYSAGWEALIIGSALTGLVAAILAEEIRVFIFCIWFFIIVISRLQSYWLYRALRKEILSQGTLSVWSLKR